jgi:hypothetical protein
MPELECPICHRTIPYASREEVPYRPFCSDRCKMIDLGCWLNEEYRISEEVPEPPPLGPNGERHDPSDDERMDASRPGGPSTWT